MQEERLRALYSKHQEDKGYLALIAEDMPGGFSKGQISSQLRRLGLKKGAASKHKGKKRKKEVASQLSLPVLCGIVHVAVLYGCQLVASILQDKLSCMQHSWDTLALCRGKTQKAVVRCNSRVARGGHQDTTTAAAVGIEAS